VVCPRHRLRLRTNVTPHLCVRLGLSQRQLREACSVSTYQTPPATSSAAGSWNARAVSLGAQIISSVSYFGRGVACFPHQCCTGTSASRMPHGYVPQVMLSRFGARDVLEPHLLRLQGHVRRLHQLVKDMGKIAAATSCLLAAMYATKYGMKHSCSQGAGWSSETGFVLRTVVFQTCTTRHASQPRVCSPVTTLRPPLALACLAEAFPVRSVAWTWSSLVGDGGALCGGVRFSSLVSDRFHRRAPALAQGGVSTPASYAGCKESSTVASGPVPGAQF
jgi:hypothetical protein